VTALSASSRTARRLSFALAFACVALTPRLAAQQAGVTVSGTVRDSLGQGISGALVQVAGGTQRAESGANGTFALRAVPSGAQELVVRRIGYRPLVQPLAVSDSGETGVAIRLAALAQPIAPVIVRGRETLRGNAAAFYARRASGRGRFLTAAEIDNRQLWTMRDVMRTIPGTQVRGNRGRQVFLLRGATVPPVVYLDGIRMAAGEIDLNLLDPRSFLGIEIYSGPATTPPEYAMSDLDGRSGGVIVVWTREGRALPRRPRRGDSSPAEVVAGLIQAKEVLTAEDVDRPAHIDPSTELTPVYPDSLFEAGVAGSATLEFVVEPDGQLRIETLSVVSATHPAFGAAARDALLSVRFVPAIQRNRNVAQVVMLTVRFEPVRRP
jgi:TonB family protein